MSKKLFGKMEKCRSRFEADQLLLGLGKRYIYTGCASGSVVIYDLLTGRIVQVKVRPHSSALEENSTLVQCMCVILSCPHPLHLYGSRE